MIIHQIVKLEGPTRNVKKAKKFFARQNLHLADSGPASVILEHVPSPQIKDIINHAKKLGLVSISMLGDYEVRPRCRVRKPRPSREKTGKINLQKQKWYFASELEETYPLLFVRSCTDTLCEVEFFPANNGMPHRATLTANEIATLGLRPATSSDFEEFDFPQPSDQNIVAGFKHFSTPQKDPLLQEPDDKFSKEAIKSFVNLMNTVFKGWSTRNGEYAALVPDEDSVQQIRATIKDWAMKYKYPEIETGPYSWEYKLPGSKKRPSVLAFNARMKSNIPPDAVGPWYVSIKPMWINT